MNIAKPMITSFSYETDVGIDKSPMKNILRHKLSKTFNQVPTCFKNPDKPTPYTQKSAQSIPTQERFLNRFFRPPSFDSN